MPSSSSNGNTQDPMSTGDEQIRNVPNIEISDDSSVPTTPEIIAA